MLFYRPQHPETGEMWDTWLFWHEGRHYLFYLAKAGEKWDNISMARSSDGVTWEELGPILRMAPGVTWMGTGSTWQSSNGDAFYLNFSEWRGPRQTIFFAQSKDLLSWNRLGGDFEFVQDERWYDPLGRWDCIWTIPGQDGGLYGYWTATPRPQTGGRFGFGHSADGLRWEALPPPIVHGAGEGEVGAIERINGRYFMMFGSYPRMMTLVADQPEGPFRAARRNRVLLTDDTYFTRFYPTPSALLVCHHSITADGHIHMGLLKEAQVDGEGTLRLTWWKGNDQLFCAREAIAWPTESQTSEPAFIPRRFDMERGIMLEGKLVLPPSAFSPRRGVLIGCEGAEDVAVFFDSAGRAEISQIDRSNGHSHVKRWVDREMLPEHQVRMRVVLAHSLMEIYLDEVLIDCISLPNNANGSIGIITGGDCASISNLVIGLPPPKNPLHPLSEFPHPCLTYKEVDNGKAEATQPL